MTDVGYVVAGYGVILGGIVVYAGLLLRRLRTARQAVRTPAGPPPDAPR